MTLFKGSCHTKLIIGSLSLSILFSHNSNSFPLNSNIPDAQQSKNPFSYTHEDKRKKTTKSMFSMYQEIHPNLAYPEAQHRLPNSSFYWTCPENEDDCAIGSFLIVNSISGVHSWMTKSLSRMFSGSGYCGGSIKASKLICKVNHNKQLDYAIL